MLKILKEFRQRSMRMRPAIISKTSSSYSNLKAHWTCLDLTQSKYSIMYMAYISMLSSSVYCGIRLSKLTWSMYSLHINSCTCTSNALPNFSYATCGKRRRHKVGDVICHYTWPVSKYSLLNHRWAVLRQQEDLYSS